MIINVLLGTIVNALAVVIGSLIGLLLSTISKSSKYMLERTQNIVLQGLGLAILFLGLSMGLKTENFIFTIISLVLGGCLGEALKIETRLQSIGNWLEASVKNSRGNGGGGSVAEGFVTATLLFCVGAMAVLGAIDSGLHGDHAVLYTKSLLDGISAILLTATLGFGVIFSAAALFAYQGAIALSAKFITSFLSAAELDTVVREVSAVGGVLIAAIGINVLQIKKINVVNMLPSIFIVAALALIVKRLS